MMTTFNQHLIKQKDRHKYIHISNKWHSFDVSINPRIQNICFTISTKIILSPPVFSIDNKMFLEHQIDLNEVM